MSDLVRIYNDSIKPRPVAAKAIPGQEVNFVDQNNEFHEGWKNFNPARETKYTSKALEYYGQEYSDIVIPESFHPAEEGINLHRWQPGAGYYNPGEPQS